MTDALAVRKVWPPRKFTPEQVEIILNSCLSGASLIEAAPLLELANARDLNPLTKQVHFVKRWDSEKNAMVWAAQVGIDGFRTIAERTGLYDGQDEPEFIYDAKGKLACCKVKVYRKDWSRPAVGVAHFSEFAQFKKDKTLTRMWAEKPHVMLAKCAEAMAFRRGFPDDTSGLYAPEEMPEIDHQGSAPRGTSRRTVERDPDAPPPPPALSAGASVTPQATTEQANSSKVTFGPSKGKVISALTGAELSTAIALGEQKLTESPSAAWAGLVALCLGDLRHEHSERIERAIDASEAATPRSVNTEAKA